MANIEMRGVDEYTKKLAQLQRLTRDQIIGEAVFEGARIVADTIKSEVENIPVDGGWGTPQKPLRGLNRIQKAALVESMGVTPMRDDNGFINVKVGFDGYNPIRTNRWPKGQPNAMVARSIERGTTWLMPYSFMRRAMRGLNKKVVGIMQTTIDHKIYAIMRK